VDVEFGRRARAYLAVEREGLLKVGDRLEVEYRSPRRERSEVAS
jgi:hypothetical protein